MIRLVRHWVILSCFFIYILALQSGLLLASNINAPYNWYRYQGAPDSDDQAHDCGPACVAMAIQFATNTYIPIRDIRSYIGHTGSTDSTELKACLDHWGISYNHLAPGGQNVVDAINDRNHIVICPVSMSNFSEGLDIDGASDNPSLCYNRYNTYTGGHFIIVKGVTDDGQWVIVYDPNVWGSYPYPKYWYSNGEPKGKERYYRLSEFYNAISTRGIEITENPILTRIAVTDPGYDDIGDILETMGYEYTEIQDSDLANYNYISQFNVIFINCSWDCDDNAPAAQSSLEQFVREGGYVYASDWAFIYVETSFPGHIFFPSYPYTGDTGYVQADVVDMGLAEYLGKSTMEIHFDLPSWVVIQDIAPDVSVYLRGTVEAEADTAQTSSSLSEPVRPPTSREPSSTIQSAETMAIIPDMPLCMSFKYGEGRVLFTTFHNEPQVSEDERKLLEYLVLIPYTGSLSDELANAMEDSGYDVEKENLGTINQGEVSSAYKLNNVKVQNLAFGANWAGSTMKLSVYEPGGNLYEEEQSDQPPLVIRVQQAEVGEWSYSVTAVDIPYDNYPYVLQVGSSEGIPLAINWNLISLPLRPPNTDPDAVLSSIAGLYNSVWAYDPDEGWSIYAPDIPSDLQEIVSGKGYWVKMNEPGTLDIQGTIPESTAVLLKGAKWNLAGYCSLDRKDVEDCNLPNCINSVWEYNANTGWSIYAPGWLTDLEAMKPGCGYWMKVRENHPEDCVWDVNQPSPPAAPPLTMRSRYDYVSEDRPEMPYLVWGSVEIDAEKITGDGTVVLKVDGKIQSSYTLGTVEGYGDSYVLGVPAVIDSYSQAELYVQIDGNQIKSAIVPPGRPGDIIRFDLSVRTPPKVSMLHQNYPNPFNPDTWIPYQLSEDAHVVIKIYATTGQLVRTLNLGHKPAGFYTDKSKAAYWDGKNEAGEHVASGIYFYTTQAVEFTATRKMVVFK